MFSPKVKKVLSNSTLHIGIGAVIGLALGIGLSFAGVSDELVSWLALPGDLFLRALKCIVIIMIFCSMIMAVVDMVKAGKAVAIGWKTIGLYAITTCAASLEGLAFVLIFKQWFSEAEEETSSSIPLIQIFCDEAKTTIFEQDAATGVVSCVPVDLSANNLTTFLFEDLNNVFVQNGEDIQDDISFSETLQEGIFKGIVSENIVMDLATGNFLAVICFAILFGVALIQTGKKRYNGELPSGIFSVIEECNYILVLMIEWVIKLTPFAVVSLISGALAGQDDLLEVFSDVGLLVAAGVLGYACHLFVFYPLLYFIIVRKNPYAWMKNIFPAQCMSFACASSAATLPINIKCAVESGEVSPTLANFVLSLGATINMDGTALYFPVCIVYLGMANGMDITVTSYILIFLLSTIGSAGTAPVPSAQLVLLITAYNTVFSTTGTPDKFGLIVLVDWFMDRCATTVNISGDSFICRIVSHLEGKSLKKQEKFGVNGLEKNDSSLDEQMEDNQIHIVNANLELKDGEKQDLDFKDVSL